MFVFYSYGTIMDERVQGPTHQSFPRRKPLQTLHQKRSYLKNPG